MSLLEDAAVLLLAEKIAREGINVDEPVSILVPHLSKESVVMSRDLVERAARIADDRAKYGFALTEEERAVRARAEKAATEAEPKPKAKKKE